MIYILINGPNHLTSCLNETLLAHDPHDHWHVTYLAGSERFDRCPIEKGEIIKTFLDDWSKRSGGADQP